MMPPSTRWRWLTHFVRVTAVPHLRVFEATMDELLATGNIRVIQDPELRGLLVQFFDLAETFRGAGDLNHASCGRGEVVSQPPYRPGDHDSYRRGRLGLRCNMATPRHRVRPDVAAKGCRRIKLDGRVNVRTLQCLRLERVARRPVTRSGSSSKGLDVRRRRFYRCLRRKSTAGNQDDDATVTKPSGDSSFTTDVAEFYESMLVPLIFRPYARDLAERTRDLTPSAVLEIACGTGVVTRALSEALPQECEIVATDLNEAMVAHAEHVGTSRAVEWRQADVMALPYADETFDVVVCQFAVMFFPDRVAAYREVRRVLRPGGSFVFNVWNSIDQNEFSDVITSAVGTLYPDDPPLFLARTPHGHGSPTEIEADVRGAGFEGCVLTQRDEMSVAPNPAGTGRRLLSGDSATQRDSRA